VYRFPAHHLVALTILPILVFLLSGCASTPGDDEARDPFERYNRAMYAFNDKVDKYALKPLAKGYQAITPAFVDRGITNFFNNLDDVTNLVNNLLQLKPGAALSDLGRITLNTSLGLFGLVDVATAFQLERHDEDFGQTLGYWGVASGPYLVLPFWGPSTVRDAFGLGGDYFTEPLSYIEDDSTRYGMYGLEVIDTRADLLAASRILERSTFDPYAFLRDAYLQQRRNQIFDGNPPLEMDNEFLFEDDDLDDEGGN